MYSVFFTQETLNLYIYIMLMFDVFEECLAHNVFKIFYNMRFWPSDRNETKCTHTVATI